MTHVDRSDFHATNEIGCMFTPRKGEKKSKKILPTLTIQEHTTLYVSEVNYM